MSTKVTRSVRLVAYALALLATAAVALVPFLKKSDGYTTNYVPYAPDAEADFYTTIHRGDDDDDGGY